MQATDCKADRSDHIDVSRESLTVNWLAAYCAEMKSIFPTQPPNILAAFLTGIVAYMMAMAWTVYDGILSLVCQPFCAVIFSGMSLIVVLLISATVFWWDRPREWWLAHPRMSQVTIALNLFFLMVAISLAPKSELEGQQMSDRIAWTMGCLGLIGWHGLIFGVLYLQVHQMPNLPTSRPSSNR